MFENLKKNKMGEMRKGDVQEKMLQCMYLFTVNMFVLCLHLHCLSIRTGVIRFEVLIHHRFPVIFWVSIPCSLVSRNQCFAETHCRH
jgi:hypothetical protein